MEQPIQPTKMLQGEVGGELVEQALLSHFEDHPDQPLPVDERWGNDALCTQKFQCLFDQWDRAVAFHRMHQELADKPEILSPSAFAQPVGSPDLIQVFIDGMLSFVYITKPRRLCGRLRWLIRSRSFCVKV